MTKPISAKNFCAAMAVSVLAVACSSGYAEGGDDGFGVVDQAVSSYSGVVYRGVNLASADFGEHNLPGTFGSDYTYPSPEYGYNGASYFIGKGMNTFRVPFRWERLQRSLGAAFDTTELTRLSNTVSGLTNKGAYVLIDPHNYARYHGTLINSGSVTYSQFNDFWTRLANVFKGNPRVIFGLMNEPHSMSTDVWVTAANQAITAIRATGATNLILVPGNAWTGAHSWSQNWYGTPNAQAMLNIKDSGNNYAFEVHQYLDADYSGTTAGCVSGTIGSEKLSGFTNWLKSNGKRGFLGEFGGGRGAPCPAAIDNMIDHMEANSSVWLGWTYWAAGPMWGDYIFTLEPSGGDRPQMDALESHLTPDNGTTPPPPPDPCKNGVQDNGETGVDCGGSCAACPTTPPPSSCSPTTYEAEAMTLAPSGAGQTEGSVVLIWSNGSVSKSHSFAAGATTITVAARGAVAAGVWPNMRVSVGSTVIGNASVNSTTIKPYAFPFTATAGTQTIKVEFTNDHYAAPEDRNLYVDKVEIGCGSTTPVASCTDGVKNGNETGVDCGGSCKACAPVASCTDGVKNGNETGVDCGGSCAACPTTPPPSSGSLSGSIKVTNDWGAGYCADLTVKNGGSNAISSWTAVVSTPQTVVYTSWNATFTGSTPTFTFKPSADWAAKLGAGASATVGFCANRSSGTAAPSVTSVTSP